MNLVALKARFVNNRYSKARRFRKKFIEHNKYIPNFENPKTYNEKINYRKRYPLNPLFSRCACKIEAKEYVAELISKDVVIENLFVGMSITPEKLNEIVREHGNCVLKANHNSGRIYMLSDRDELSRFSEVCYEVSKQLQVDFGKLADEAWYSDISPRLLVEKKLTPSDEDGSLRDYKFHVFKQNDGSMKVLLHIDFGRGVNHSRSYFDEDLNWLPFAVEFPSLITKIQKPKNYDFMLQIAKKLADPFSYVRVDLYNIDGEIFFGEMTFAPGSGISRFSTYIYDYWMGGLWQRDPRY
ncbi:ATP-grasp fold amidoligase family protein [Marinobacter sp. X15-166B]|uniref:ATP-grasp fold amidoligase family protein n=1 Tax=Marinobacter sp. X15-166B TaxID=1897620 RepID=UPI00085C6AFC|nr:ATP-grasp fold amidoligase family protein [Marinobacter sp. X15-166B]OEY68112.1 hypothetical protein BG841_15785 [Marinobacter sp. X15-166B]